MNASVDGNGYVYLYYIDGVYHAMFFDNSIIEEYSFNLHAEPLGIESVSLWMTGVDDAVLGIRVVGSVYTVVLRDRHASVYRLPIIYYSRGVYVKAIRVKAVNATAVSATIEYSMGTPDAETRRYQFGSRRATLSTRPYIDFTKGYLFLTGMYETDIIYFPKMKHWRYVCLEPVPVEAGLAEAVAVLSRDEDSPASVAAYLLSNTIRILDFGQNNVSLIKRYRIAPAAIARPEYIYSGGKDTLYIVSGASIIPYRDGWIVLLRFSGASSIYPAYYVRVEKYMHPYASSTKQGYTE